MVMPGIHKSLANQQHCGYYDTDGGRNSAGRGGDLTQETSLASANAIFESSQSTPVLHPLLPQGDTSSSGDQNEEVTQRIANHETNVKNESRPTNSIHPSRRKIQPPAAPRRTDFGDYFPDGGWGWIVCIAASFIHMISHGTHLSFGILLGIITEKFNTSIAETVWLGSLSYGLFLLAHPLVVAICHRKSPRLLAVVGGMLFTLGYLFMSFSVELHQLYISYVLFTGIGSGIVFGTSYVITGRYFRKKLESAEMMVQSGTGLGIAVMSTTISQTLGSITWLRGIQCVAAIIFLSVISALLFRSANLYHPRRKAILHIRSLKNTSMLREEFENRPAYCDFSPLHMRSLQTLMFATCLIHVGFYTPFVLLPLEAKKQNIHDIGYLILPITMGLSFSAGCILFGVLNIRRNLKCMIHRQYLCQIGAFGAGLSTSLLTIAEGPNALILYSCIFGFLCGAYSYSLRIYIADVVSTKLAQRSSGYLSLIQAAAVVVGPPVAQYLNNYLAATPLRAGFLLAGMIMILGSLLFSIMPYTTNHKSNLEVIHDAHIGSKVLRSDMILYGMEVSDNDVQRTKRTNALAPIDNKMKLYGTGRETQLGDITEEKWSDIEALEPCPSSKKVQDFLKINKRTHLDKSSNDLKSSPDRSVSSFQASSRDALLPTILENSDSNRSWQRDNLAPDLETECKTTTMKLFEGIGQQLDHTESSQSVNESQVLGIVVDTAL